MHLQSNWASCAFTGMHPHTNPQSRCPPQPFSPIQGSMFLSHILFLSYIACKRQHGSACVLARCGVQSSRRFVTLWSTCVVLSRCGSSLVAWKQYSYSPLPGTRGDSIVRCGLSCLGDLNSDLYRLCGSLHDPDTFWVRGLSWINNLKRQQLQQQLPQWTLLLVFGLLCTTQLAAP